MDVDEAKDARPRQRDKVHKAKPDPPEERLEQKCAKAAVTSSMRGAPGRESAPWGTVTRGWPCKERLDLSPREALRSSKAFWSRRDRTAHPSMEDELGRGVTEAEQNPSQAQARVDERR